MVLGSIETPLAVLPPREPTRFDADEREEPRPRLKGLARTAPLSATKAETA